MPLGSLLKVLAHTGEILTPHIDAYQRAGKFPERWLIEIINEKPADSHFHPSGDCLTPALQLWREKKGVQSRPPITTTMRRTFDFGHMAHSYYGNILVEMGFIDPDNVELERVHEIENEYGKATAKGTGDLVGVHIPGRGEWLVDMKTMNNATFEQGPTPLTFDKWTAQVNCYGDWFGYENMMILAIQKDYPHKLREFIIPRNDDLLTQIYNKWAYVQTCLDNNEQPANILD